MQKIIPHLWYDKEAADAVKLYITSFAGDSLIKSSRVLEGTPSGDAVIINFEIYSFAFQAISAGPLFTFNPSVSFHVKCEHEKDVDEIWEVLIEEGKALMDLDSYPFSKRYGWLEDKYGVSWQIIHTDAYDPAHRIVPVMMFVGENAGRAEEAMKFYASVFPNSSVDVRSRYEENEGMDQPGTVRYADFTLEGIQFGAMDSAQEHDFQFNEAISFIVNCSSQDEIDHYWDRLSAHPEAEQCGWLKDKFGFSWQIVPTALGEMMNEGTPEQVKSLTEAFLEMKKFDISALKEAFDKAEE